VSEFDCCESCCLALVSHSALDYYQAFISAAVLTRLESTGFKSKLYYQSSKMDCAQSVIGIAKATVWRFCFEFTRFSCEFQARCSRPQVSSSMPLAIVAHIAFIRRGFRLKGL
jgi:hypothetical protein